MRELYVDWAGLHSAFQMNMPEVRCFLSLEDGKVLKLPPGDGQLGVVRSSPMRFIAIEAVPSRIQYQWLDDFIKSIDDESIRSRMEAAINGKGAFRRFKDILLTLPDERRRWFEYRDVMMRKRIVEWVHEQSITPMNESPWGKDGTSVPIPAAAGVERKPANDARDVEALRDFLIDWSDKNATDAKPTPLDLDELARQISNAFLIRAVSG